MKFVQAPLRHVGQSLLQHADQRLRCALERRLSALRQIQLHGPLIVSDSFSGQHGARIELPNQVARSRWMKRQCRGKFSNLCSGMFGNMGKNPDLRSADAGAPFDFLVVMTYRLEYDPELPEYLQHFGG